MIYFQAAAEAKKEILVLKPEILDQRKILDKGEVAFTGGQWAEALRLFKKADRIYSDNRSKAAIQKVENLLEEQERKLAEEKKEKEIQAQKYLNMTDDDRHLGLWFLWSFYCPKIIKGHHNFVALESTLRVEPSPKKSAKP